MRAGAGIRSMENIQNLFKDMIGSFVENGLEGELHYSSRLIIVQFVAFRNITLRKESSIVINGILHPTILAYQIRIVAFF